MTAHLEAHAEPSTPADVALRTWVAVVAGSLGAFIALLNHQIVNAAMADIQNALGADPRDGSWITTAYLVGAIVIIPMTGWLSRALSTRLLLIGNGLLFVLFSIACGFAGDLQQMVAARALQGMSGGVMAPMAFTLIITLLPKPRQATGMAVYCLTVTLAPAAGPVLGGWLAELWGWRSMFYVMAAPSAVMVALLWASLEPEPRQLMLLRQADWWGIFTMVLGLSCLQLLLELGEREDWFDSTFIVRLAMIAAPSLALFVWIELRREDPLINLRLLARRNFLAGAIASCLLGAVVFGGLFILPLYLSRVQGYNSAQIGHVVMWTALPQFALLPFIPYLVRKVDPRLLLALGFALFAGSNLMNIALTSDVAGEEFILPSGVRGIGSALVVTPLSMLAIVGIGVADAASASALSSVIRNLGGAIGVACLRNFLINREQLYTHRLSEAVSPFGESTRLRLEQLAQYFVDRGSSDLLARHQAVRTIAESVHHQASILAFSDTFLVMAAMLLLALATAPFYRLPPAGLPAKAPR